MTDKTSALRALIEAVESGEWTPTERPETHRYWEYEVGEAITNSIGRRDVHLCVWRSYQGSLGAAKALHEALLPTWFPGLSQNIHSSYWFVWVQNHFTHFSSEGNCPARAWLLAILRAYLYEQENK